MTAIKSGTLDSFLGKPAAGITAILIYGGDPSAVRDIATRAAKRLAGSLDDPFRLVILEEDALAADPGRLLDEVQSQSLMGGDRVVWVRGADQSFLRATAAILDGSVRGNIIVAEAGNLAKGSALRKKFEESECVFILPVYEATAAEAGAAVESALSAQGFSIDGDALALLVESAGANGSILAREVEKLSAYCLGANTIALDDVRAVCGNATGVEADDLVDAVFGGDLVETDRYFQQLIESGTDSSRILTVAHSHVVRLIDCRRSIERGARPDQAMKSAQPPIFFKRQPAVQSQLKAWEYDALLSAASSLSAAILQARLNSALAASLASRALLAVARSARSQRLHPN